MCPVCSHGCPLPPQPLPHYHDFLVARVPACAFRCPVTMGLAPRISLALARAHSTPGFGHSWACCDVYSRLHTFTRRVPVHTPLPWPFTPSQNAILLRLWAVLVILGVSGETDTQACHPCGGTLSSLGGRVAAAHADKADSCSGVVVVFHSIRHSSEGWMFGIEG